MSAFQLVASGLTPGDESLTFIPFRAIQINPARSTKDNCRPDGRNEPEPKVDDVKYHRGLHISNVFVHFNSFVDVHGPEDARQRSEEDDQDPIPCETNSDGAKVQETPGDHEHEGTHGRNGTHDDSVHLQGEN